jgi:DNA-binding SARP family transcriptional activator/predicted ATPase
MSHVLVQRRTRYWQLRHYHHATMTTLTLYCFGSPRVERDGQPVSVTRRRTMALLIYLALTGRPHSREALATLLWPEHDAQSARAHLRRELFRLKQLTGEEMLFVDREQMAFRPEAGISADVLSFRRRLDRVAGHGHAPGRLCRDCQTELEKAIALYDEAFLTGFNLPDSPEFDEWQFFLVEELQQQMAGALRTLIAWHESQGQALEALPLARRWLSFDPLNEEAHRALMRLYNHAGQQAAAIRQYETCARLLDDELGVAPAAETAALYEAIRARQLPAPAATVLPSNAAQQEARQPNLPAQSVPLVGRTGELEELAGMLDSADGPRLITITGPGGIGKTRLAIAAAWAAAPDFDGATTYVSLAPLSGHEQLAPEIAGALGLEIAPGEEAEARLLAHLHERRLLLVLDNFEHLLAGAPLLANMLETAPDVSLLVTSRERLNLSNELVYALDGLAYPREPDADGYRAVLGYDAMILLLQRAQFVRPGYEPEGSEELAALARICRLVRGMPLALVLAAGWLELLSPAEIANEIAGNLDFLESNMRDLPSRQRSVRAVFDASWGLLDERSRATVANLAVFRGSFTREAAQAVSGASLALLRQLANQSWIQRDGDDYQIHELLRQYAEENLRAEPQTWEAARERHAAYYADFLEAQFEVLNGNRQEEAFAAIGAARDNLFIAWDWLALQEDYSRIVRQMLPALFRWQEIYGRASPFFAYVERALGALPPGREPQLRIILLAALSAFYRDGAAIRLAVFGNVSPARDEAIVEAWLLAEENYPFDFWGVVLATMYGTIVDSGPALSRLEQLLAHFRAQNRRWDVAFTLQQIVFVILRQLKSEEQTAAAAAYVGEAYGLFQALGDVREGAYSLRLRGHLSRIRSNFQDAIAQWKAAHDILLLVGDQALSAELDWHIGDVYLQLGEFAAAFDHYRQMSERAIASQNRALAGRILSKESLEASRYGHPDHAWTTRREALAFSQEAHDRYGEAWNTWEMAELYRLQGDFLAAREWFERARALFEQLGEEAGLSFYARGLGDLAYSAGNYRQARDHYSQSLAGAEATGHAWAKAYARCGLGLAALGLQEYETARSELARALRQAATTGDRGITLFVLGAVAELLAATGYAARSAAVASHVRHHPVSWAETRSRAEALLEATGALPSEPEGDVWKVVASIQDGLDRPR